MGRQILNQRGFSQVALIMGVAALAGLIIAVVMIAATTRTNSPKQAYPETATWPVHSSELLKISFSYPPDWFVREDFMAKTVYISNVEGSIKGFVPEGYQQFWITGDDNMPSAANESRLRDGRSDEREVQGSVSRSEIVAKNVDIRLYSYRTDGGQAIEAFWNGDNDRRLGATNSVGVKGAAQSQSVQNLRRVLSTVRVL